MGGHAKEIASHKFHMHIVFMRGSRTESSNAEFPRITERQGCAGAVLLPARVIAGKHQSKSGKTLESSAWGADGITILGCV